MKIGIFGGAFNPIHNGHLHLLDELYRAEMPFGQFDKLLIIPTANPPHKSSDGLISAEHRIAMIKLAIKELEYADNIEISSIELESTEKSYTYTTLVKLKKIYPDAEFVLFIGSDQLFYFPKWYSKTGCRFVNPNQANGVKGREYSRFGATVGERIYKGA